MVDDGLCVTVIAGADGARSSRPPCRSGRAATRASVAGVKPLVEPFSASFNDNGGTSIFSRELALGTPNDGVTVGDLLILDLPSFTTT